MFSLFAIISARARFAILEPALRSLLALEIAWSAIIMLVTAPGTFIALEIAWLAIIMFVIASRAFIALEMARRAVVAPFIAARWWPVVAITGIFTRAEIAALGARLVVPVLIILSLVKPAHITRLERARARSIRSVGSMFAPAVIR